MNKDSEWGDLPPIIEVLLPVTASTHNPDGSIFYTTYIETLMIAGCKAKRIGKRRFVRVTHPAPNQEDSHESL